MTCLWLVAVWALALLATARSAPVAEVSELDVDAGLHYAALQPTSEEWEASFPGQQDRRGVLHAWLRCVDDELRAYVFLESVDYSRLVLPTEYLMRWSGSVRVDRRNFSNLAFHVAGAANETVYGTAHWFGGLAWTASVRPAFDRPGQRSVEVRVAGWSSYFDYPLRLCVPAAREPQPEPRRAMVVFVKANSPDGSDVPAVVAALGLHARHHACVLQLTAYEIVVREALIPSLLANPAISDLAAAGTLRFVRRTSRPNRVDGWVHSDQAVAYNLAMLRWWRQGVALFFFDMDEFWPHNAPLPNLAAPGVAVFDFPRRNVFCTPSPGCSDSEPEVRALVAADARTEWAAETVDVRGKSAVLPDRTAVAFIHNAKPFPGQLVRKLNAESGHGFVHHFIFMLADSAARAKSNQDNVLNTSTVLAPVALDRVLVRDEPCSPTGA